MDQNEQSNGPIYALMGCGVLLIIGLCVLTGIGGYMFFSPATGPGGPIVVAPQAPQPQQPFPQPQPQPQQPVLPPQPQPQQPVLPPPPQPAQANVRVRATITFITPGGPVPSGTACDFQVEFPSPDTCRAQVYCGGRLLYGGPNAGYFPCTRGPGPSDITGQDGDTTSGDTDASFTISTPASIMTVRDDASGANGAFTLTARVDSAQ